MHKTRIYNGKLLLVNEKGKVTSYRKYNLFYNIKRTSIDIYQGLYYKYPKCCIIEFCIDNFKGIFSARYKKELYGENIFKDIKTEHVPCHKCIQKFRR